MSCHSSSGPSPGKHSVPILPAHPTDNICRGILIQYFIQYGSSFVDGGPKDPNQGTAAFRIPWGIQMIPGAILFVGMFFLPRSPRWLASKDRWEEAIQVLAHLHGKGDVNHPKVLAEYQEIEEALRFEREEAVSSFKALTAPRMLKRVILGMSIQMWSQLCGMNIMMYYSALPPSFCVLTSGLVERSGFSRFSLIGVLIAQSG